MSTESAAVAPADAAASTRIGELRERSLHAELKSWSPGPATASRRRWRGTSSIWCGAAP